MQKDFHYYATYAAAFLAGYSHEESLAVFDLLKRPNLSKVLFRVKQRGPLAIDSYPIPVSHWSL